MTKYIAKKTKPVKSVFYDRDNPGKTPIELSGEHLFIKQINPGSCPYYEIYTDYNLDPEWIDENEPYTEITGTFDGVIECEDGTYELSLDAMMDSLLQKLGGNPKFYSSLVWPKFIFEYADIYLKRLNQDHTEEQTSFRKELFKNFRERIAFYYQEGWEKLSAAKQREAQYDVHKGIHAIDQLCEQYKQAIYSSEEDKQADTASKKENQADTDEKIPDDDENEV